MEKKYNGNYRSFNFIRFSLKIIGATEEIVSREVFEIKQILREMNK